MKKLAFALFIALTAQAAAAKVIVRVITFDRNIGRYTTPETAWRAVEPSAHGWPVNLGALLDEVEARAGDGATVGIHDVARTFLVPGMTQTLLDTDVRLLSLTGDTAEMRVHSVDVRVPVNGIAVVGSDRHLVAVHVMDHMESAGVVDPLRIQKDVITPPKAVSTVNPVYPEEARRERVHGIVILQCSIDAAGNVEWVHVLKGLPNGLTESALDAVRQWHFEPATKDGKPVPVLFNLTTNFKLN
jgi:TonB family protein